MFSIIKNGSSRGFQGSAFRVREGELERVGESGFPRTLSLRSDVISSTKILFLCRVHAGGHTWMSHAPSFALKLFRGIEEHRVGLGRVGLGRVG